MAKKTNAPLFTDITNTKKGQPTEANLKSFTVVTSGPEPTYTAGITNSTINKNFVTNPVIVQTRGPGVSAPANLSGPKKK